jgi:hypothetical protein
MSAPRRRLPAVPMQPVVDPAGWTPAEFRDGEPWVLNFSDADVADILAAVGRVERAGIDLTKISRGDFDLPVAGRILARVYDELTDGVGIVQVRGLPVRRLTRTQAAIAYLGIGTHFGQRLSQNALGHVLGHVKDLGFDYDDPRARGYQTAAELGFHTDPCDFVSLLCLHTAQSGGASRVVSSVNLYNEMLKRRPDLVAELTADFYWTRHGELAPDEKPYYLMPVWSFVDGYFSGRGISTHIMKAQKLPGVPAFTAKQKEAIETFRAMVQELAVDIPFKEGDFQILSNHVMLHSRRPYVDWPDFDEKRHLLRLWLSRPECRPQPELVKEAFRGIEVAGYVPRAPLDAEAEAA